MIGAFFSILILSIVYALGILVGERSTWKRISERMYEVDVLMTENPKAVPDFYKRLWELREERGWHKPRRFKKRPF